MWLTLHIMFHTLSWRCKIRVTQFKHRSIMAVRVEEMKILNSLIQLQKNNIKLRWGIKLHLLWKFCYGLRTWKAFEQTCYKHKVYRRAEVPASKILVAGTTQQKFKPPFAITSSSGSTEEAFTESSCPTARSNLSKHCWRSASTSFINQDNPALLAGVRDWKSQEKFLRLSNLGAPDLPLAMPAHKLLDGCL